MTAPYFPSPEPYAQRAATKSIYEYAETRELVALVNEAAERVRTDGEAAFRDFRVQGSRWRRGDTYVFVLDASGKMVVHADPTMEGRNQLDLRDINGKPIVRGLIEAVTALAGKLDGWYHYQWPVPGALLPRWKSSYARLVQAPSGQSYMVGSGMYNDRMERAFVMDAVANAVALLEKWGPSALAHLRDPRGPFIAKDTYVFVTDLDGVEIINSAFPNLEGRNVLDLTDTQGTYVVRQMIEVVKTWGSGWVDYMWPRPGESASTEKSTYVSKAQLGDRTVLVGCGVYLADAPKETAPAGKMTASELMTLVRDAGALLEDEGEFAYPELRTPGSAWFRDDTYLFILTMDGTSSFHAADPVREGHDDSSLADALGRPIGKMILDVGASPAGEGWIHYMYPKPGELFPEWKSTFVKRVTFPSGVPHIVGCGIYNMQMDKAFIEDMVDSAADLVADLGREAFPELRDKTGPFAFMDTYVFVTSSDGTELVNAAQPSLEGRNLVALRDVTGKAVVQEEIAAALTKGSAWLECYWFKPGDNTPAPKQTYVRKVQVGPETFIVGSGIYL